MDITRQTFANLVAGLYLAGGLLLLSDFVFGTRDAVGAAALALHVWPVTLAGEWAVSQFNPGFAGFGAAFGPSATVCAYVPALLACTIVMRWLVSGRDQAQRQNGPL